MNKAREIFESRRERLTHPHGSFDKAGRWYPAEDEVRECCNAIRSPSRAYPYSYMHHCRTLKHCKNLVETR